MEQVQGSGATNSPKTPAAGYSGAVFVSTRPLQPGGRSRVQRMSPVSTGGRVLFDDIVKVNQPMDWPPDIYRDARKGPWMQAAVDRCRFRRRIKQTETELGDIFTDCHREKIKRRLLYE
jgi:hypothetical protein